MNCSAQMKTPPPYGLTAKYWDSLSPRSQELYRTVSPLPDAVYTVDWHLGQLEQTLAGIEKSMVDMGGSFDLSPDFQRGHVWTVTQQVAFVESMLRNVTTGRILFNCPGWAHTPAAPGDIPEHTFVILDGLQRLTAVRLFMADALAVFGGLRASDLRGSPFDPFRNSYRLQIGIFEFNSRQDLLSHYLAINSGGTVHSQEEIQRVQGLLVLAASSEN